MEYEIRPLQLKILDILKAVDEVCRTHHLRYYLWAGTMLGAVRHQGFIPWDDDADIAMPRPDYDLLMAHAREWLPSPLEAVSADTMPDYPGGFGKIVDAGTTLVEREHSDYVGGVYIDVFPIDGVPTHRLAQRFACFRYALTDKLIYFLHRNPYKHGRGPSSWLPLLVRKLFTHEGLQRTIRQLRLCYPYDHSAAVLDYDDGFRGIIDKKVLGAPTPVAFEGIMLQGVSQANAYLSQKYGPDYMTPPDIAHQRQHHFFYLDYHQSYHDYADPRQFTHQPR